MKGQGGYQIWLMKPASVINEIREHFQSNYTHVNVADMAKSQTSWQLPERMTASAHYNSYIYCRVDNPIRIPSPYTDPTSLTTPSTLKPNKHQPHNFARRPRNPNLCATYFSTCTSTLMHHLIRLQTRYWQFASTGRALRCFFFTSSVPWTRPIWKRLTANGLLPQYVVPFSMRSVAARFNFTARRGPRDRLRAVVRLPDPTPAVRPTSSRSSAPGLRFLGLVLVWPAFGAVVSATGLAGRVATTRLAGRAAATRLAGRVAATRLRSDELLGDLGPRPLEPLRSQSLASAKRCSLDNALRGNRRSQTHGCSWLSSFVSDLASLSAAAPPLTCNVAKSTSGRSDWAARSDGKPVEWVTASSILWVTVEPTVVSNSCRRWCGCWSDCRADISWRMWILWPVSRREFFSSHNVTGTDAVKEKCSPVCRQTFRWPRLTVFTKQTFLGKLNLKESNVCMDEPQGVTFTNF